MLNQILLEGHTIFNTININYNNYRPMRYDFSHLIYINKNNKINIYSDNSAFIKLRTYNIITNLNLFYNIPDDILNQILLYLDQYEIYNIIAILSKQFNNILTKTNYNNKLIYPSTTLSITKFMSHRFHNPKLLVMMSNKFNFINIKKLNCSDNSLTLLPELPPTLIYLDCHKNILKVLPALPNSLTHLNCRKNILIKLPPLPSSLKELYCGYNEISDLPILPESLQILYCIYCQISVLPELPSTLSLLFCSINPICSLPRIPISLTYLDTRFTNLPPKLHAYLLNQEEIQNLFASL